ncbi:hypothetical protein [Cupriavidus basilensis]|nr:hypothetical protein [Cupriavidus basilensis]
MNGLQVQRSVLFGSPTLLSPAVTDVAGELRRAAQEIEILAIDLLAQQRAEANGHRATLGDE